jgi:hypothetical protein
MLWTCVDCERELLDVEWVKVQHGHLWVTIVYCTIRSLFLKSVICATSTKVVFVHLLQRSVTSPSSFSNHRPLPCRLNLIAVATFVLCFCLNKHGIRPIFGCKTLLCRSSTVGLHPSCSGYKKVVIIYRLEKYDSKFLCKLVCRSQFGNVYKLYRCSNLQQKAYRWGTESCNKCTRVDAAQVADLRKRPQM